MQNVKKEEAELRPTPLLDGEASMSLREADEGFTTWAISYTYTANSIVLLGTKKF